LIKGLTLSSYNRTVFIQSAFHMSFKSLKTIFNGIKGAAVRRETDKMDVRR
jgi:hypothetical protein